MIMARIDRAVVMENSDTIPQVLRVLSDRKCLEILKALSVKPFYNRELVGILKLPESRISEKVRSLKSAGLISEYWTTISGKPVKMYRLNADRISISFGDGRITAASSLNEKEMKIFSMESYRSKVPHVSRFVGREEELKVIQANAHVLVTGLPGIGKTTLLAKYASNSGVPAFWHRITEVDTLKYLLMKINVFLKDLGFEEPIGVMKDGSQLRLSIDTVIHYLRRSGAITIIDDLHKCRDPEIMGFLQDMLLSEPKLQVKLVTREKLPFSSTDLSIIHLGGLDMSSSARLFGSVSNFDEVFRMTGGHPLMITLLRTFQGKVGKDGWKSKGYLLKEIMSALGKDLSEVLGNLSFFREDVEVTEVKSIFGKFNDSLLEEGEFLGFLRNRNSMVGMSDFLREIIYEMTDGKHEIHGRIANYYLNSDKAEHVIEGIYHVLRSGDEERIIESLNRVVPVLIDSGFMENLLAELDRATEIVGYGISRQWLLLWMGKIYLMKGDHERSLHLFREVRKSDLSLNLRIKAMSGESQVLEEKGDPKRSLEILQEALSMTAGRDELLEANLLLNLSGPLVMEGKISVAHSYLQRAMDVYKRKGELRNLYVTLANYAWTSYLGGSIDSAISTIDGAINGFLSLNAFYSYADCIVEKAIFHSAMGKLGWADDLFQEAIEIFESTAYNPRDLMFAYAHKIINDIRSNDTKRGGYDLRMAKRISGTKVDNSTLGLVAMSEAELLFRSGKITKSLEKLKVAKYLLSNDFPNQCMARLAEYTIRLSMSEEKDTAEKLCSELIGDLKASGCLILLQDLEKIRKEIAV